VTSGVLRRRGYIGLGLASAGLEVRHVAPGSSAHAAGVFPGDRLTHIDRNPTTDLAEVRLLLRELRAGDPLELGVCRGDRELVLTTTVAPHPLERYAGARCVLDQVNVNGHWLRTLCVVPDGSGPFPVVFYLPGAHWASEEYPLASEHPVPALIAALACAGVATFRVERSGLGDSQGPPCTRVDYEGELAGYRAGLELLARADWADPRRLMLLGHSLGAMHAPLLAEVADVCGVATFGAGAVPISEALIGAIQRHAQLQLGAGEQVRARGRQIAELIRLVVCGGQTPAQVFAARPDLEAVAPSHFSADEAYRRVVRFYHQLEARDIAASWRRYRGSVLALHGSTDYVATARDAEQITKWVGERARYRELPGVDHQMSDARRGAPLRLASAVREVVLEWVAARVGSTQH
jgi:uncharacterized protein